jgi:hypothetical protein
MAVRFGRLVAGVAGERPGSSPTAWTAAPLLSTEKCPRAQKMVEVRAIVIASRGQSPTRLPSVRRVGDFPRGSTRRRAAGGLMPSAKGDLGLGPMKETIRPGSGRSRTLCEPLGRRGNGENRTRVACRSNARAVDAAMRGKSHRPRASRRPVCVFRGLRRGVPGCRGPAKRNNRCSPDEVRRDSCLTRNGPIRAPNSAGAQAQLGRFACIWAVDGSEASFRHLRSTGRMSRWQKVKPLVGFAVGPGRPRKRQPEAGPAWGLAWGRAVMHKPSNLSR